MGRFQFSVLLFVLCGSCSLGKFSQDLSGSFSVVCYVLCSCVKSEVCGQILNYNFAKLYQYQF